jgi:ankyrin repeat protein
MKKHLTFLGILTGMSLCARPCFAMANNHHNIIPVAIEAAIVQKKYKCVKKYFLQNPHQINQTLTRGETPLTKTIQVNDNKLARWLLLHGADANLIPAQTALSPLMRVAEKAHPKKKGLDMVKILLMHQAAINTQNNRLETVITIAAARCGSPKLISFLLKKGADPLIKNHLNITPLDIGIAFNPHANSKVFFEKMVEHQAKMRKEVAEHMTILPTCLHHLVVGYLSNEHPQPKKIKPNSNRG